MSCVLAIAYLNLCMYVYVFTAIKELVLVIRNFSIKYENPDLAERLIKLILIVAR